jgi:hypothetical protein
MDNCHFANAVPEGSVVKTSCKLLFLMELVDLLFMNFMVNFQEDRKCTPNTPKEAPKNSWHVSFEVSSSSSRSADSLKCHFKYKNPLLLVDCSVIPSIKGATISKHYTVPFLPCSCLALFGRFCFEPHSVSDQTQGSGAVFILLHG